MKLGNNKRAVPLLTVMLVLMLAAATFLMGFTDIDNHWAEETIEVWTEAGLISGYEDGTFRPAQEITRAEFTALVNRSFDFTERQENHFEDVPLDAWFASHVDLAVAAGYISGYDDGTFRPQEPISRQEVAAIVYRLKDLPEAPVDTLERFADADAIPEWSREFVAAVVEAGLMRGYDDDTFRPEASITRAESVVTLDRIVEELPFPDFEAELKLDQEHYHFGDTVTIIVINTGQTTVELGYPFEVKYYADGIWTDVALDLVWPDVLEMIEPGHDFQQDFVPEENFQEEPEPGRYRISKEVRCAASGQTMVLREEFRLAGKFSAELKIEKEEYEADETIAFTVTNTGQNIIQLGYPFTVLYEDDSEWKVVELDLAWIMVLLELKPGEELSQEFVPAEDFKEEPEPGYYRVIKEVECTESGRTVDVEDDFFLTW